MLDRIQKILRECGIASRREAEKMILAQRVKVNGRLVNLGDKANLQRDRIEVDGKFLGRRPDLIYILLNKPKGIISTCNDPKKRKTVLDLLAPELRKGQGIHPVGRLDLDSTGALLLTNDGSLTLRLTHPRSHLAKTYQVWVEGIPPEPALQQWREGVTLDGQKTLPAQIEVLASKPNKTLLKVILREGRNRQIRRVAAMLGFPALSLHRIAIGSLKLSSLPVGQYRILAAQEVDRLVKVMTQTTNTNPKPKKPELKGGDLR